VVDITLFLTTTINDDISVDLPPVPSYNHPRRAFMKSPLSLYHLSGGTQMAYFQVTGTNGNQAVINGNTVSKVIDFGSYRTIYQGADTNNYMVTDTLASILTALRA
jgi:hypothetical protein